MITLFRRIRQQLITSGSTTKYLLYAIGEILLVVVGILIALQVNNWNEDRSSVNETKSFLSKKMVNLQEDHDQLIGLHDFRVQLSKDSESAFNTSIKNMADSDLVALITTVTIEKRFSTFITRDQIGNIANYFKNIDGTGIDDIEQDYLQLVDIVTFSEDRLNIFSETLETDLWRMGFFNDNRIYFNENDMFTPEGTGSEDLPPLILSEENGLKSLSAIIRRNEIQNKRLADLYMDLIEINKSLRVAIQEYISNN